MKKCPANKLLRLICAITFFGLYQGIFTTVSGQSQDIGDYKVQLRPDWSYSGDKSSADFYVFTNSLLKIDVSFKKEATPCPNTMEFSKLILPIIQNLQKQQWIIDQRKPAAPYPFAGQSSCHFMRLKSKATGQIKFILNPLVKAKMYQIEITSESLLSDPPEEAIYFISLASTTDSPAVPNKNIKEPTPDINNQNVAVSVSSQPEPNSPVDDLSGFSKVKAPAPTPQKPQNVSSSAKPETLATKAAASGVSSQDTPATSIKVAPENQSTAATSATSSIPAAPAATSSVKTETQVTKSATSEASSPVASPANSAANSTNTGASSQAASSGYDPAASDKAASIPDGDEQGPVINPVGATNVISSDAGWAYGLANNPKSLLDALEGGRPGGDVNALMALLRQTQGPLDDNEDKAMMNQYAPYAASGSSKAHKAIRSQSELLLEAMMHRDLMMQAAWEYDFAISQNEIANLMQDEDEKDITAMLAEIQKTLMQDQQTSIESIVKQSEAVEQIPTPAELVAEEQEERTNATKALEVKSEASTPENVKPLGKWVKSGQHTPEGWTPPTGKDESMSVNKEGVAWAYKVKSTITNKETGKFEDVENSIKMAAKASCPDFIPVYQKWDANERKYVPDISEVQFLVELSDNGSDIKVDNYTEEVSVYVGIMPAGIEMDGDPKFDIIDGWINARNSLTMSPLIWREVVYPIKGKWLNTWDDPNIVYHSKPQFSEQKRTEKVWSFRNSEEQTSLHLVICTRFGWVSIDYKWQPAETPKIEAPPVELTGNAIKDAAIAEHQANITAAMIAAQKIREEMKTETDKTRREELRLQALHMDQNAHDSKDLIESIKTGTIVKTRGPWDEHSAVVLAETSRKMREEFQRAGQIQASYVRMLKVLDKYNPDEAKKFRESMNNGVVKGIFDPGGFTKAQQALDALYSSTKGASQAEQKKLESQQDKAFERLAVTERNLRYVETLKSGCDKAIFVGTLFTGMGAGLALSMAYEGACTGVEKGPKEALKNMVIQGGTMLAMAGVMKAGSWGIGKLLNPKVVQSEANSFKNLLEANKYQQEMEWNKALVNQLKEKTAAFEKSKAAGGTNYLEVRKALDDAVSAANSSSLAKRIMKNELTVLENQIKSGATRDYSKLKECLSYQKVFDNRLQKSIYPRADADMISKLRSQGYNVEKSWFQEYRNACSRGVNADRDMGLLASCESKVAKNGQPVSMGQFMEEAKVAYDGSYKAITGRSATLADQSVTTSAHSESFPLSWLQKKAEGPFTTLDPPVTPQDFEKAGKAIYNKVQNALSGPDPAFVNMKKACASLSKDLKSKVLDRLKNPSANANISQESAQKAAEHWEKIQKAMEDFATDKCDPLTTMKKLQQLTGSTSVSQSAEEVQRLVNKIGGA